MHFTVGESFADWVNETLGLGLKTTTIIFTVALVAVLGWAQMSLRRYVPFAYWLTVVVLSVDRHAFYTDILTDAVGVPLVLSTAVFAAILAVVFGIWYARESHPVDPQHRDHAPRGVLLAGSPGDVRSGYCCRGLTWN